MSMRYKGGVISATPPTTTGGPYGTAPGIWTLEQQMQAQKGSVWPTTTDPQFNYVTMLLHGDGTNGAQNNTFLDSSTNNFTITRNGNTTQGTFSPYGANWSTYFPNTGSTAYYLTTAGGMPSGQGTAFTMECWIYLTDLTNYRTITRDSGGSNFDFGVVSDGTIQLYLGGGATLICASSSGAITANAWYHIAVTRTTGNAYTIYVNGVSVATGSNSTSITANTIIGYNSYSNAYNFVGYISNFRVTNTLVYSTTFTPPTAPLTAISGTSLLTCQSNRFVDNSSNAFSITINGTPSIQRFSPFSPTSAYSTSTVGGSGYFDGNGDYLSVPSNSAFAFGTGDFTIELWSYYASTTADYIFYDGRGSTLAANIALYTTGGTLNIAIGGTGGIVSASVPSANTWHHFAITRSGTSMKLFVDGTQVGSTATNSTNLVADFVTIATTGDPTYRAQYYVKGYISDIRVVKGSAVYTSNFTPPTSPLSAIANTSLLTSMTNAGILDNAEMNDLETVGSAQISTSVKKYGTGSMKFNGSTDYLNIPDSPLWDFGSGNFTIEMWIYPTTSNPSAGVLNKRANSGLFAPFNLGFGGNLYPQFLISTSGSTWAINITSSIPATVNAWSHVAITRSGSTFTIWVNGVSGATASNGSALSTNASQVTVAATSSDGTAPFPGYIDELRITKGYARYTTSFTPPTGPFQNN